MPSIPAIDRLEVAAKGNGDPVARRRSHQQRRAEVPVVVVIVRASGCGEIHINVDEVDTDTRRFYERHGFVNVEPGEYYRMLCYVREL